MPGMMHDRRGMLKSPSATKGYRPKRPPATKGRHFPPDPIAVGDIVKLLDACAPTRPGKTYVLSSLRCRALIVILWRTGLRINEALALEERDLLWDERLVVVRRGKGGRPRKVGMDDWGWSELAAWMSVRKTMPFGPVLCVVSGTTKGMNWHDSSARLELAAAGKRAGLRRRCNAHSFRHAHAVELWREGLDMYTIQQQLGHARLDVTALYLRGVGVSETLQPIIKRSAPLMLVPSPLKERQM